MAGATQIITRSVTDSFLITSNMNISGVTYKMSTGATDAGTVNGNTGYINSSGVAQSSVALPLGPGEGDTIISGSPGNPLDNISFTVSAGSLRVIMTQS